MKVTREQAAENRERVLESAARLFRERGFDGVGVADVMNDAGLTHGAFYGQFGSKDDLIVEAVERATATTFDHWSAPTSRAGKPATLAELAHRYLSPTHRDNAGLGCVMAALGPEVARRSPTLRHAITAGIRARIEVIAGAVAGRTAAARRRRALEALSAMVGALVIARMVDDEALSDEILKATEASFR